jgi:dolichyldiphosphatase
MHCGFAAAFATLCDALNHAFLSNPLLSHCHCSSSSTGAAHDNIESRSSSGDDAAATSSSSGSANATVSSSARAALEAVAVLSATLDDEAGAAAMPPSSSSGRAAPARSPPPRLLHAINESTKWVVSAAVMAVLLAARNEWAAWAVVGAVASSFLCKVLKCAINGSRPPRARKKDPGMPSSHANSLNFLSAYAALSLRQHASSSGGAAELGAATVAAGLFLTWLRVALGYHTWPQVIVGGMLGSASAAAWFYWGTGGAVAAIVSTPGGYAALCGATVFGIVAFAARNVLQWVDERAAAKGGAARVAAA